MFQSLSGLTLGLNEEVRKVFGITEEFQSLSGLTLGLNGGLAKVTEIFPDVSIPFRADTGFELPAFFPLQNQ